MTNIITTSPGRPGRPVLIGQPCRARNVNSGLVVRDAGRDWLVVGNMNENSHMELIFIDPTTDSGAVYRAPAGSGSWALHLLPGNRIAVGTFFDGMFMIFDIERREWVKTVKFPGEEYIWTLATGKDGRVYGGTYPGGKLGALDPETYEFEDLGAPSPGNMYLRWTSTLPDGRIFCQCGFARTETLIFDPGDRSFTLAPAALQGVTQGVEFAGFFVAGQSVYRVPDLSPVEPFPFPRPDPNDGDWSVDVRLTRPEMLVVRQGERLFRSGVGDSDLALWTVLPQQGLGVIFGSDGDGRLLGVRGQEYFCITPGDDRILRQRITGEAAPRDTMFLRADDRGRLWGGPTFGQTVFYTEAASGHTINTNAVSDHGGEVYDVAVVDGICYAVSYSGGEIIRFDPEAPWDQAGHVNPRTIARVGPEYIRPSAGVHVGPDGRLYSGWLAKYGERGGAIAITDPATGETELIADPLGPQGIAGLAVVYHRILLGTTTYGNGLGNDSDASAQFGVYDLAERRVIFAHTIAGAASVNNVVYSTATGVAAFLVDGQLRGFDVGGLAFIDVELPPEKVTSTLAVRGDSLLYAVGATLYARDFATGDIVVVAEAPAKISKIAAAPTGEVYLACGAAVYRVEAD